MSRSYCVREKEKSFNIIDMEKQTYRSFWGEAAKGGTIIGLVMVAFSIVAFGLARGEVSGWNRILNIANIVVFILLVYGFTRSYASRFRTEGFSYGRSLGFVLAMMIFTGFIAGIYSFVVNRFVAPETVEQTVDQMMLQVESFYSQEMLDKMTSMMRGMMTNPIAQILSNIFSYGIMGGLVGLLTSVFTRIEPDPFGGDAEQQDKIG